jgi:hypothetical protein
MVVALDMGESGGRAPCHAQRKGVESMTKGTHASAFRKIRKRLRSKKNINTIQGNGEKKNQN